MTQDNNNSESNQEVTTSCPHCQASVNISDHDPNKKIECTSCHKDFDISEQSVEVTGTVIDDSRDLGPVQENLTINCPSCEAKLDVSGFRANTKLDCPSCTKPLLIPDATPAVKAKPASAEKATPKKKKVIRNTSSVAVDKSKIEDDIAPPTTPSSPETRVKSSSMGSVLFLLLFLGVVGGSIYSFRTEIMTALKPKKVDDKPIKPTKKIKIIAKRKENIAEKEVPPLSAKALEQLRSRLRPSDLDIYGLDQEMELYLQQFKDEKKLLLEEQRLEWGASFRSELVYLLERTPFYGYIFLNDGGPIGGWLSVSDGEQLYIKTKKTVRPVEWKEIKFKQWEEIITYLASKEANNFRIDGNNKNAFLAIADLYTKLALFYHWYDLNDQAEMAFDKARLLDSSLPLLSEYVSKVHEIELVDEKMEKVVYMTTSDNQNDEKSKYLKEQE